MNYPNMEVVFSDALADQQNHTTWSTADIRGKIEDTPFLRYINVY